MKNIWKLIKSGFNFEWNNPLKEWNYAKEWFLFPKVKVDIVKPWRKYSCHDAWLIDFISSNMGWKTKFGYFEFEHEPFIELTLLNRFTIRMTFECPINTEDTESLAYWEGILYIMGCYDSNTNEKRYPDEEIIYKTYINNVFSNLKQDKEYDILPYLTHKGFMLWVKGKGLYGPKPKKDIDSGVEWNTNRTGKKITKEVWL